MLPAAWEEAPASMLEAANKELTSRGMAGPTNTTSYVRAYVRKGPEGSDGLMSTYMLVQESRIPTSGFTLEDLERVHGDQSARENVESMQGTAADLVASAQEVTSSFDRTRASFELTSTVTLAASGAEVPMVFRSLSAGTYYSGGVVQFNLYTPVSRFEALQPELRSIIGSLTIAPGQVFTPAAALGAATPTSATPWLPIIGLPLLVLGVAVWVVARRKEA
jgi:LPXTG-motif cell wall-anchored protein